MSNKVIRRFSDLRKRVEYFLSSSAFLREEVGVFLTSVLPLGEVVIFGGMLRELSIRGNESFKSDVDLVIDVEDLYQLERALSEFGFQRNKFGGYRIKLSHWIIDIWDFKSTWAFKKQIVQGNKLSDLCKTTFFNWDAIIYNITTAEIHAIDGYIESISNGLLDINLKKSANPIGNIVRSFRYSNYYDAKFSLKLKNYIYKNLKNYTVQDVINYEKSSYDDSVISSNRISKLLNSADIHQKIHFSHSL